MKKIFILAISIASLYQIINTMDNPCNTVLMLLINKSCSNPANDQYILDIAQYLQEQKIDINSIACYDDKTTIYSLLEYAIDKQNRKLIEYALKNHTYITPEIINTLRRYTSNTSYYYNNLFKQFNSIHTNISELPKKEVAMLMNSYYAYYDWYKLLFLAKQYYKQQQWVAILSHVATEKYNRVNPKKRTRSNTPWNDKSFAPYKRQRHY